MGFKTLKYYGTVFLTIAGLFEIVWAIGLKFTQGFTKLWPSLLTLLAMLVSFFFLAQAVKIIPVGTGYAVWTGIGAVGTAILGMIFSQNRSHFPNPFALD